MGIEAMKSVDINTDLKPLTLLAWVFLSACTAEPPQQGKQSPKPAEPITGWVLCPEQRPEMCPQHYAPVCGYALNPEDADPEADSPTKTHSNSCSACANNKVVGYQPGVCPEE